MAQQNLHNLRHLRTIHPEKDWEFDVAKIAVEVNNTAKTGAAIVCRHSTKHAQWEDGRPKVPCRAKVEGASSNVVVTLTSAGNKLRFPGTNDVAKTLTLPASGTWAAFSISGQIASATTNDAPIEVRLDGAGGGVFARKGVTVLWVDIDIRNQQGASFSSDNGATSRPSPALLGAQILSSPIWTMSQVVELVGTVSPSSFTNKLDFLREKTGLFYRREEPSGYSYEKIYGAEGDISFPEWKDLDPRPNGKIYDIDAPGIDRSTFYEQGTVLFQRVNFKQHATYKGVRCSDDFEWFARITIKKTSPKNQDDYEFYYPSGPSDNESGEGSRPLSQ